MESLKADSDTPTPSLWRRRLKVVAWVGACPAVVHPLALLAARIDWKADLLTHFQTLALTTTLAALSIALVARLKLLAIGLIVIAAFQVEPVARYSSRNPVVPDAADPQRLRILMANVLCNNDQYEKLSSLIIREKPDVVGLVEVSSAWLDGLAKARKLYPYRLESPEEDGATGLALWFRKKPVAVEGPRVLVKDGWPLLRCQLDWAGRPLEIWLVHPSNPLRHRKVSGNPELAALAAAVCRRGGSQVVIGDLNCTEGSPHFGDFLAKSGLRDSRLGFGKQPSWPGAPVLRIPIDHAFVSNDLAVADRRLGDSIGSDHLPILVEIAPSANRPSLPARGPDPRRNSATQSDHSSK